jgi:hypothetical protein
MMPFRNLPALFDKLERTSSGNAMITAQPKSMQDFGHGAVHRVKSPPLPADLTFSRLSSRGGIGLDRPALFDISHCALSGVIGTLSIVTQMNLNVRRICHE